MTLSIAVPLSVCAALLFAVSSVLQQRAARNARVRLAQLAAAHDPLPQAVLACRDRM